VAKKKKPGKGTAIPLRAQLPAATKHDDEAVRNLSLAAT
jgi:hypothetical protein